jgi:hypothetical protein
MAVDDCMAPKAGFRGVGFLKRYSGGAAQCATDRIGEAIGSVLNSDSHLHVFS